MFEEGPFARTLLAVLDSGDDARLEGGDDRRVLVRVSGRLGALIDASVFAPAELTQVLAELVKAGQTEDIEIAAVGGGPEIQAAVEAAQPRFTQRRVDLYHVTAAGVCWKTNKSHRYGKHPVWDALQGLAAAFAAPFDAPRLREHLQAQLQAHAAHEREVASLGELIGDRKPVATYVICAVIVVLAGLGWLWTPGDDAVLMHYRMGALFPTETRHGQWWRLAAATFLHGGLMHLAFNSAALVAIGSSLEKLLGTRRFVILYFASGLGGSLASLVFVGANYSLGASGAIWGLLGAEAVLAYRPRGLLPQAGLHKARAAVRNVLLLNIGISFMPNVDMAGHFGGGLVGAGLMFFGVITAGMPRLDEVHVQAAEDRPPPWMVPVAALFALFFGCGIVVAQVRGQPWLLKDNGWSQRTFARGFTIDLPKVLTGSPVVERDDRQEVWTWGNLSRDPVLVAVKRVEFPTPIPEVNLDAELAALHITLKTPDTGELVSGPTQWGDRRLLVRYKYPNGVFVERALALSTDALWAVDVGIRPLSEFVKQTPARRVIEALVVSTSSRTAEQ